MALMLELQMESLPLTKESLLPNMCVDSLPLAISTTAVWSKCLCILLDTHALTLLVLLTLLQDMSCPKLVYKHALKQIGHYLIATSDERLVMKLSENLLKIDSFPDANFAGMYGYEAIDDPLCVKS